MSLWVKTSSGRQWAPFRSPQGSQDGSSYAFRIPASGWRSSRPWVAASGTPTGSTGRFPHSEEAINHLLALFAGEPVEIDPSLGPIRPPHHREPRPLQEIRPTVASTPKLFDQVRQAIQTRHYSYRTEEAYVGWIRRFILFHHKRRPEEMGAAEVSGFLTSLAVDRRVSASTQNQAMAAILFLYKDVFDQDFGWLDDVVACETPPALAHRAHPAGSARCVGRD